MSPDFSSLNATGFTARKVPAGYFGAMEFVDTVYVRYPAAWGTTTRARAAKTRTINSTLATPPAAPNPGPPRLSAASAGRRLPR
ncbi:hypothetical protein [Arthrobacter sp. ISL-5]|uniref:hypothetical protein n=1 Tax=Arthrobacter sp. ISL-5 TaxID=2819111 RepID=UPI001BEC488D|nr:hypothetical protein [Arthrobacter sp. ISL-5]MBT2552803.1 hypothetical protein [Arthrobacter sp. ISL-5]